jgi:glycosyltransferase involved in cell wall biosynthesis
MGKKKKIFIGWIDICGQIGDLKEGYRKNGHTVFTMSNHKTVAGADNRFSWLVYPDWLLKAKNPLIVLLRKFYTLLIVPPMRFCFWLFAVFYFDVFHFMWVPEWYTPLLLSVLKKLNKKIIVHFVGSDIRWVPTWLQEFEFRGLDHPDSDVRMEATIQSGITLDEKLRYVRTFEKYADIILSLPEQAQLQLRPYYNFYLPVQMQDIHYQPRQNPIPLVCIGTSGFKDKGSQQLLDAFYKFYENTPVPFELVVIKGMKHTEVMQLLMRCDIFIYTPYGSGTGKFGMEALAAGAVTLTGYDKAWHIYPEDCPVVHVQEKTLIQQVLYYLQHPDERKALSLQSRQYAQKHADIYTITKNILDKLDNTIDQYEYYPQYFRHHATFNTKWDAPNSIEVCNKWNRYVQDCDWYKKYVPKGERDGIIF